MISIFHPNYGENNRRSRTARRLPEGPTCNLHWASIGGLCAGDRQNARAANCRVERIPEMTGVRERDQRAPSCVWRASVSAAALRAVRRHLICSAHFFQLGCCAVRSGSPVPLLRGLFLLAADFPTCFPISSPSVRRLAWSRQFWFGSSRSDGNDEDRR